MPVSDGGSDFSGPGSQKRISGENQGGLSRYWRLAHRQPPHEGTQEILRREGISFDGMLARQVSEQDLDDFDYIIAMDAENIGSLRSMAGFKNTSHIKRLLDYVEDSGLANVPDPYYTGNFEEVCQLIKSGCEHLLASIQKEKNCE